MLQLFLIEGECVRQTNANGPDDLRRPTCLWIDAVAPDQQEMGWLREVLGIDPEAAQQDEDIEFSARAYEEGGAVYLRSDFLSGRQQDSSVVPVRLVLKDGRLITLHEEDVPILRLLRLRLRNRPAPAGGAVGLLVEIYARDVEYTADALEDIYAELRDIGAQVLAERRGSDAEAAEFIARLAVQEARNGTLRRNLMDTRRALSFLARERILDKGQNKVLQQVLHDIESLYSHTAFVFDKINFLMDAIVGFININQNKVVKIFTVAAVAMLPPTLIASIYGMNFEYMPELSQPWGYPMSLALMVVSVVVPFWYFRRKGWLK
ncbi:MAG: magnesium/cobalt transporter CorA [Thiobacillaceae bacterium]|nr:magnesium/cobalt transporter CorA [Thiobacillaceae bacterium]MDW8323488.1 magnesium/cobalt transporter CorA [Burkholderiales bacterium]